MKKSTLFLACCIGLMLFASCKKDPVAPTISAITDTGYVTENAQIFSGDNIKVGFNATGEKLTKIEITLTQNGTVINSSQATIENLTSYSYTATFTVEATGAVTVTGIVTDANGLTASKSFNIICNEKDPVVPDISICNTSGFANENTEIYSGEIIEVGFIAIGEKLTRIGVVISQNDSILYSHSTELGNLVSYTYLNHFNIDAIGVVNIRGTVIDALGQTASADFNIICKEKPNSKFVGHYEGNALATGFYQAEISGLEPIQQEFTDREVPVILDITEGYVYNKVFATCIVDDRTMIATGTVEGDKITFETFNDVITFDYDLGIMIIHPEINVTYSIVSTLVDSQLNLEGNCTGNGIINYGFFSGTTNLEAIVGGSLNKMR